MYVTMRSNAYTLRVRNSPSCRRHPEPTEFHPESSGSIDPALGSRTFRRRKRIETFFMGRRHVKTLIKITSFPAHLLFFSFALQVRRGYLWFFFLAFFDITSYKTDVGLISRDNVIWFVKFLWWLRKFLENGNFGHLFLAAYLQFSHITPNKSWLISVGSIFLRHQLSRSDARPYFQ